MRIQIVFPFDAYLSKNRTSRTTRQGRMYKSPESRKLQEAITWLTRTEANRAGAVFREEKFWVGFHVEKPNNRFDAANVMDAVLDAVAIGIGVNDRWAAISRLDWEIKKINPVVRVVVEQG